MVIPVSRGRRNQLRGMVRAAVSEGECRDGRSLLKEDCHSLQVSSYDLAKPNQGITCAHVLYMLGILDQVAS